MSTTRLRPQRTLVREAEVRGIGFLTGAEVRVRFRPAPVDQGIVFVREDIPGAPGVPATIDSVVPRQRRTTIQRGEAIVEMVEHVMAALAGSRIDNCVVSIDASETPGCDGSSRAFNDAIAHAGSIEQDRPRKLLVIEKPATVSEGQASLTALPGRGDDFTLSYQLDYGRRSPIVRQGLTLDLTPETFRDELAPCRTFLLQEEAEALRKAGIGARITTNDLLIFGPDGPIGNALRFPDECARHKMLDLVGDLALIGCDLAGQVIAHRSGHQLNASLVRALREAEAADPPPAMDIRRVLEILPHRYPFLLVDRVTKCDPGRFLLAIKNVTFNEPFFQGHWPGNPTMPGVLILEALAQAGGLLISGLPHYKRQNAVIVSIDKAKFRRPVCPGDQLALEVALVRAKGRTLEIRGVAKVAERVAAEANIRIVLVEPA